MGGGSVEGGLAAVHANDQAMRELVTVLDVDAKVRPSSLQTLRPLYCQRLKFHCGHGVVCGHNGVYIPDARMSPCILILLLQGGTIYWIEHD